MAHKNVTFAPLIQTVVLNTDDSQAYQYMRDQLQHAVTLFDKSARHVAVQDIEPLRRHLMASFLVDGEVFTFIRTARKTYVLLLPFHMEFAPVFNVISQWCNAFNWKAIKHDPDAGRKYWDDSYIVHLRIKGYPIECWFQEHIAGSVECIGKLLQVNPRNLPENDKRFLEVDVRTANPYRIPKKLEIVANNWSQWCRVYVEEYFTDFQDEEPPSDEDPEIMGWSDESDTESDFQDKFNRLSLLRVKNYQDAKDEPGANIHHPINLVSDDTAMDTSGYTVNLDEDILAENSPVTQEQQIPDSPTVAVGWVDVAPQGIPAPYFQYENQGYEESVQSHSVNQAASQVPSSDLNAQGDAGQQQGNSLDNAGMSGSLEDNQSSED